MGNCFLWILQLHQGNNTGSMPAPWELNGNALIEFGAPGSVPGQAAPAACAAAPVFCTNVADSYSLENEKFCATERSKEQYLSQATLSQTGQRLSCPKSSPTVFDLFYLLALLLHSTLTAFCTCATRPHLWSGSQRRLQVTNRPGGHYLSGPSLPAERSLCLVSRNASTGLAAPRCHSSLPALQTWT